jgi:hypothetical protein
MEAVTATAIAEVRGVTRDFRGGGSLVLSFTHKILFE